MTSFTPTPTEYHGIVFRSKSEALFARVLDLRTDAWIYEPAWLADPDGWVPDFFVLARMTKYPHKAFVIEYKPRIPTETYLKQLAGRMARISNNYGFLCICAYGSFYDEPREIIAQMFYDGESVQTVRFANADIMRRALEYRFDLQASDAA